VIATTDGFNDRMHWVTNLYHWGRRGRADYAERADNVVKPKPSMFTTTEYGGRRLKTLPDDHDVDGEDMPRHDVKRVPTRSGNSVLVGSSSSGAAERFKRSQIPNLQRAFTDDEQRRLEVYYEYPDTRMAKHDLGECFYLKSPTDNTRYSVINIAPTQLDDEATVVHETLHSLREQRGPRIRDVDSDEAEVELETLARVSYDGLMKMQKNLGYYAFLDNGWQALQEDRVLLTGGLKKSLQGEAARKRVRAVFAKTNMSKLKIGSSGSKRSSGRCSCKKAPSVPEWLDRFFEVDLPGRPSVQVHLNQKQNKPLRSIVSSLRKKFGTFRLYEWRDGKKVRVA
jgi:hypothetical protein